MSAQHPITPPPELLQEWCQQGRNCGSELDALKDLATQAAQWGADQVLEKPQHSAAVDLAGLWSTDPTVPGRYICLRGGVFAMYDVSFYRDLQQGITGQWEATEVCVGNRAGYCVQNLQPAMWLPASAIPLPIPQQ